VYDTHTTEPPQPSPKDATTCRPFPRPPGTRWLRQPTRSWVDWDNDDDYLDAGEDVTSRLLSLEWRRGQDYASQLTGRSTAAKLTAVLDNTSGDYSSFNTGSLVSPRAFLACDMCAEPFYGCRVVLGGHMHGAAYGRHLSMRPASRAYERA
jgi:hypothetical protein